jgi:hypothetical protein
MIEAPLHEHGVPRWISAGAGLTAWALAFRRNLHLVNDLRRAKKIERAD